MPISQLAESCWVLEPEGGPDGEDRSHHDTEAAVLSHFGDCYPAGDYPDAKPQAVATGPCWTVICDGDCGEEPEDDEYGSVHLASRADAEKFAESAGWIVTRDGLVFCDTDAPDCSTADLAVTEPTPGQLTLDGKEVGVPEPAPVPVSVWQGELIISGVVLHVHVLSDGTRIIEAEDVAALMNAWSRGIPVLEEEAAAFARWQQGGGAPQ